MTHFTKLVARPELIIEKASVTAAKTEREFGLFDHLKARYTDTLCT